MHAVGRGEGHPVVAYRPAEPHVHPGMAEDAKVARGSAVVQAGRAARDIHQLVALEEIEALIREGTDDAFGPGRSPGRGIDEGIYPGGEGTLVEVLVDAAHRVKISPSRLHAVVQEDGVIEHG